MIKSTIIHSELLYALAAARHGDAIVVCDANMPIPCGCNVIDVSLTRGVPTFLQTVRAVLNDLVAEKYEVFELMPQYNPEMYRELQELLPQLSCGTIGKAALADVMKRARAVIRTGEFGSCCTMVLYSASGMDKYVEKFSCCFGEDN